MRIGQTDSEGFLMSSWLEDTLAGLDPGHSAALHWFVDHEGEVGPRPWRSGGLSVVPDVSFPIVAQRGIHQPSGWSKAISITVTRSSQYLDGRRTPLGDGTWALPYLAHSGVDGTGLESRWNRALMENWLERVPVGVFVPAEGRAYLNLGLAMVEDYLSDQDTFLLRGPVRYAHERNVWERPLSRMPSVSDALFVAEDSGQVKERVSALVMRRKAQDRFRDALLSAYDRRCAVTGYDAEDALQAAHIIAYRGASSQQVCNGLLLRADIHLLYDRHLLSVNPEDNRVSLHERLKGTAYREVDHRSIHLPDDQALRPEPERLELHWAVFARQAG